MKQQQIIDEQKREIARLVAKFGMVKDHIDKLGVDLDTTEAGEIEGMDKYDRGYNLACTQINRILASEREVVVVAGDYWCPDCEVIIGGSFDVSMRLCDCGKPGVDCDPVTVVVVGEKP